MAEKILIVEDNAANQVLLRDILLFHGYNVITANNGPQGIQMAVEEGPDLIIMDIQMPKMSGIEAIGLLKENPSCSAIPIIAVTSYAMPGDRDRLIGLGATDYISKPIDTRAVPKIIESVLRSSR